MPLFQTAMWRTQATPPQTYDAPDLAEAGLQSFFYDGPLYKGEPTRVFAWMGLPAGATKNDKVPGIVLVHGGGGTAFAHWVKMWNQRGYAAIAMDTCGSTPEHGGKPRARGKFSGPPGWGEYQTTLDPPSDQWTFHAVESILRAHTLLRSVPEVDQKRIGITGISWGGYLTSLVAGVDSRFRFAMPVYGCGFIRDSPGLGLNKSDVGLAEKWSRLWDPKRYIGSSRMPMLWVNGATDFAFTPPMWQASHDLGRGEKTLSFQPFLAHGHYQGEVPLELQRYADYHCFQRTPLGRCRWARMDGTRIVAQFSMPVPVVKAELSYTLDAEGPWPERRWETRITAIPGRRGELSVEVPAEAKAVFLHLTDNRGCVISTPWFVPSSAIAPSQTS